jgi:hypothetical protein
MANWLASILMVAAVLWWCTAQSRRAAVLWMTAVVILVVAFYKPGTFEGAFSSVARRAWSWAFIGFSEIRKEGAWLGK